MHHRPRALYFLFTDISGMEMTGIQGRREDEELQFNSCLYTNSHALISRTHYAYIVTKYMLGEGPLPHFLVGHTFQKSCKCHKKKKFFFQLQINPAVQRSRRSCRPLAKTARGSAGEGNGLEQSAPHSKYIPGDISHSPVFSTPKGQKISQPLISFGEEALRSRPLVP